MLVLHESTRAAIILRWLEESEKRLLNQHSPPTYDLMKHEALSVELDSNPFSLSVNHRIVDLSDLGSELGPVIVDCNAP